MQISYKLKNKSGIYSILNMENGKRYIGSSKDIYNRLHEHWFNLKNNKSHNVHLQNAWNKYKEESFIFNVLEYCEEDIRFEREQFYIDLLKPEYNFSLQVSANFNREITQEQKQQISKTLKEKYASGELTPFVRKDIMVSCFIYNIKTWTLSAKCSSFREAANYLSVDKDTVSKTKIIGRIYHNAYIIVLEPFSTISQLKNYFYKNYIKAKTTNKDVQYIISFGEEGSLKYHRSYSECSKEVGCSPENLRNHTDATLENPYVINKTNMRYCVSSTFIPLSETAVPIEESLELLSGNIGEIPEKENPEINSETKDSESSYSVEGETYEK